MVLDASGENFSAGLDLSELSERSTFEGVAHSMMWHRAFEQVELGRVPVVAVLKGAVVGGGLELAAASPHPRGRTHRLSTLCRKAQRGIFVGGGGAVRAAAPHRRSAHGRHDAYRPRV